MNGEGQEEERSGERWRRGKKEKRQLNKVGRYKEGMYVYGEVC